MPYSVDFYPDQHLVLVTFSGEVTIEEEFEALRHPSQDPRWFDEPKILVDRRQAQMRMGPEHVEPQLTDVRELFADLGRCKTAIVVPRDYDFGMTRMFEIRSQGKLDHDIRVCRSMEEAAEWLEVDLGPVL